MRNVLCWCGSMVEHLTRNEKVVSSILTTSSMEKDHREKPKLFPVIFYIAANRRRLFSVIFGADKVAYIRTLSGQYLVIEILFPVDIGGAVFKLLGRLAQTLLLFSRHLLSWDPVMVGAEPTIQTISHEKISTTMVRIAVAASESVFLIPHFARTDVRPAKRAEPNAKSIHIMFALLSIYHEIIITQPPSLRQRIINFTLYM